VAARGATAVSCGGGASTARPHEASRQRCGCAAAPRRDSGSASQMRAGGGDRAARLEGGGRPKFCTSQCELRGDYEVCRQAWFVRFKPRNRSKNRNKNARFYVLSLTDQLLEPKNRIS
jgi:hypothetical protein